jgi:hypothetical protein
MKAMILSLGLLVAGCGATTDGTQGSGDDVSADLIGGACGATTQMSNNGFGGGTQSYDIWSGTVLDPVPTDLLERCYQSTLAAQVATDGIAAAKADFAIQAKRQCDAFTCPARCSKQCVPPEASPTHGVFAACSISDVHWDDSSSSRVVTCSCSTTEEVSATWDASCVAAQPAADGSRSPSPRQSLLSTAPLTVQ